MGGTHVDVQMLPDRTRRTGRHTGVSAWATGDLSYCRQLWCAVASHLAWSAVRRCQAGVAMSCQCWCGCPSARLAGQCVVQRHAMLSLQSSPCHTSWVCCYTWACLAIVVVVVRMSFCLLVGEDLGNAYVCTTDASFCVCMSFCAEIEQCCCVLVYRQVSRSCIHVRLCVLMAVQQCSNIICTTVQAAPMS